MVQFSAAVCGEVRCVTTQRTALKETIAYNNNGRNSNYKGSPTQCKFFSRFENVSPHLENQ